MKNDIQTITFKFDGANVSTDALGNALLPLACQVYNLVQACSDEEARLLSIENNCVKITFARTAVAALALFGIANDSIKDVTKFNAASRAINAMLSRNCATLEIEDSTGGNIQRFDETAGVPSLPEVHHDIKTTMAIYGELIDVGGVDPNVHILCDAFPAGVLLKVEKSDAQILAKRLYSQVGVNASVVIRDDKVLSGKILDVIDYAPEDMGTWLNRNNGKLGVESFNGVNIEDFIAEQRI